MQTDKIHELSEKLTTLHEVYSRRISDRALSLWMEKLTPFIGPELDRVLDEATTQRTMPTLGDLIQTTQAAIRRANQPALESPEYFVSQAERERHQAEAKRFFAETKRKLGIVF
jgi:hypothetical protein